MQRGRAGTHANGVFTVAVARELALEVIERRTQDEIATVERALHNRFNFRP
jgi:hypothetical protein